MKNLILFAAMLLCCTAASDAQSLTLQPGPDDGMDAEIFNCVACGYNTRNFGNMKWFDAIAWTKDGHCSNVRSLVRFDFSSIPQGATILSARLSLFFAYDAADENYHAHFPCNGTNAAVLQRITKPWNEHLVTWNNRPATTSLHQVVIPGTHSPTQNYPGIDVRRLVQDIVNLPPQKNFGMMLKLKHEKKFKKLLFGSSDHPDPSLRPRIRITYSTHATAPFTEDEPSDGGNHGAPPLISHFKLIPNPAFRESIELSFYANYDLEAKVRITDIRGNEVYNKTMHIEQGPNNIWIEEAAQWQRGIYIIRATVNGQIYTSKFVIL